MKNLLGKFKKKIDVKEVPPTKPTPIKESIAEYYEQASGWAYDVFDAVVVSRNRYRAAFIGAGALCFLLVITIMLMMPLRTLVTLLIHEDSNGVTWVTTEDFGTKFKHTNNEIKSDIYHLVQYFESYDATTFGVANDYVQSMSIPRVYAQYLTQISAKDSYVSTLGIKGHRVVIVEGIQLINNGKENLSNKYNTALVTFKTQDVLYSGSIVNTKYWQLFLTWKYKGLPATLKDQFINYAGFTVTSYQVTPINYEQFKKTEGDSK